MTCTDFTNELLYHTTCATRETLAQGAEITIARVEALEDPDFEDVDNVDEDKEAEDEGSELDRERAHMTEYHTRDFATLSKEQGMIAKMENLKSHCKLLYWQDKRKKDDSNTTSRNLKQPRRE